ncbi:DUF4365 domain-containing protein [Streptomyces sp. sk2.1]|uniref:DUF4365 domain-containing protein n=1 Tax=Streptomyces sp. sk2.1 TaxID=2478959 RepID=UPI0011E791EF|nr:DUF4365 domain-containing protein [Streptomyces sp. sk2.1]TXS67290.1 DUF4365 domain-containing protein [Streptomyces sp. sk2.1]
MSQATRSGITKPVDRRTFTTCMEQLQEGYMQSVAATAGCLFIKQGRDMFGVDAMLVRTSSDPLGEEASFYVQMKSTTQIAVDGSTESFRYRFEKRDYMERLVRPRMGMKSLLIVMAIPKGQAQWTRTAHTHLEVKQACYWISLEGMTVPPAEKPSVRIPTANLFNAEALTAIMGKIERGEPLHA